MGPPYPAPIRKFYYNRLPCQSVAWIVCCLSAFQPLCGQDFSPSDSVHAEDRQLLDDTTKQAGRGQPLDDVPQQANPTARSPSAASSKAKSQPPRDPLAFGNDRVKVKVSVAGVAQSSGVTGSWWNLSDTFAPSAGYQADRAWGEAWIKPGITTELKIAPTSHLYSGLSYVGSGNIGRDVFEQGNRGLYAIEDGYLGLRMGDRQRDSQLDVSYGRQPYKIGSGMLISVGAYNGFERGATTSFARRAWEEAGLVKWSKGPLSIDGFYLNPNELKSSDTRTRLAGAKSELDIGQSQTVGLAFMNVFESTLPYLGAPFVLLPNGREGLSTLHSFTRWNPFREIAPAFYFAGDYAHQWNDRINMSSNAFSGELGNQLQDLPFRPKLSYTFRSFQGDDPSTAKFEKFDPLFYEGSPALWATGSNGSFSFVNSNVQSHRLFFNMSVSQRDTISFYYWNVRADQANSPIQFGQAGRLVVVGGEPQLVTGVPNKHLSDDFYIENFRILSPNMYLTTGLAISIPGSGLRQLVADPATWYGGLVSFAFNY
jgi:hypothetical protein